MKATALLYTVDGSWTLEPVKSLRVARQFATATEARAWAKGQGLMVRRVPNCDSK